MLVTREQEGATFNPNTGRRIQIGEALFAVSRPGAEVKVPASVFFSDRQERLLSEYAQAADLDANQFVGVWAPAGSEIVYLDVSQVTAERLEAEHLGATWGQEAIFDFSEGRSIACDEWELH